MTTNKIDKAYKQLEEKRRRPWKGEAEVRQAWVTALEAATGLHFDQERSHKDSSYNHVIIEFKGPGLFKGSKGSAKFKEATTDRLLPYITREAKKDRIPPQDYIGIAIDGEHICFAQMCDGELETEHLLPFTLQAFELVVAAVKADTRRAVTAENLLADFGHGSGIAKSLMQALADALAIELSKKGNSKIKMLFEEWRALYGQVADMSVLQAAAINQEMCFVWSGHHAINMPARLFVIHTYNSLLIKLLAAEIVSARGLAGKKHPAQGMMTLVNDASLIDALYVDIERAGLFVAAGIKGFVEEAIFGWYVDVALKAEHSATIVPALRTLLGQLSLYQTDRLGNTRDVLRDVYQGLVPGKLRQSLGEFYTPDWLVDYTISKASKGRWLDKRVLDPTCGSGAFLLAVLQLIRREAEEKGWSTQQILLHLCNAVWGFDLNPLAVQTARVNFLMAISDLLRAVPGQTIEIPVMLADAIYSPASDPKTGETEVRYQIGSQIAGLDITLPTALAFDRVRLDDVFASMGSEVERDAVYADVERRLTTSGLMTKSEADEWRKPLKNTYNQILNLHRQQWNGIWFRVVRNFFWSATAGHFDVIIGNPPWVRWSKLPELYRERVKPTCEHYGIFSTTKYHGGNELDISAMITYTTADKWLNAEGRLAFVITGTLFKNASSAGFRNFKIEPSDPSSAYLNPVSVDDLKSVKPFEDASNHTVVAVFDKSSTEPVFPVPYHVWSAESGSRSIPVRATLSDVLRRVSISDHEAIPVDGPCSPWAVLAKGRHQVLRALAGSCSWISGRKGITADLNGVYFVPIIRDNGRFVQVHSRPEAGKKQIGPVKTAWVEPDLLYPLIKGAGDFEACYVRITAPGHNDPLLYTFVPNSGISRQEYASAEAAMNTPGLEKTRAWFESYKGLLEDRSTYRRQMAPADAPYHAVYNVGDYTFQPWKVIWPEMSSRFYAAVVSSATVPVLGKRPFVPDHKVYFASFDNPSPAYFLCGLLNSTLAREWIESHTVSIQIGDIFKHMNLPNYDKTNHAHVVLAKLVKKAHAEHNSAARALIVSDIQETADRVLKNWATT